MSIDTYSVFVRHRLLCSGNLPAVLSAAKHFVDTQTIEPSTSGVARAHAEALLFFSNASGRQVDFDLSGSLEQVLAREAPEERAGAGAGAAPGAKAGRGRPSLGVVAGEVTLLPRHWDWLSSQPAKASGTLRRLIDEERLRERSDPKKRAAALGTLLWSLAGDLPGFEEASRCLYRLDLSGLFAFSDTWPEDLGAFVRGWFADSEASSSGAPRA